MTLEKGKRYEATDGGGFATVKDADGAEYEASGAWWVRGKSASTDYPWYTPCPPGYVLYAYFDDDGAYLGPDDDGVEPEYDRV